MWISKQAPVAVAFCLLASVPGFSQVPTLANPNVSTGVKTVSPDAVAGTDANSATVTAILQPALQDVERTVGAVNTGKWKARADAKASADRYIASIQRDLQETLPNLVTQADAKPGSVPPLFTVYRNVDALYDVLLRVDQLASVTAPENEASALESALEHLESARKQLGDQLAASVQDREAQIVKLQAAVAAPAATPAAPAKPAVVDDGPATTPRPAARKKKKPATPAAKPAPANSGSASPSPN